MRDKFLKGVDMSRCKNHPNEQSNFLVGKMVEGEGDYYSFGICDKCYDSVEMIFKGEFDVKSNVEYCHPEFWHPNGKKA